MIEVLGYIAIIPGGVLLAIWLEDLKKKYHQWRLYHKNFGRKIYTRAKNSS